MLDQKLIDNIAEEIYRQILLMAEEKQRAAGSRTGYPAGESAGTAPVKEEILDIVSAEAKAHPTLTDPLDPDALARMMQATTARIGVGKTGPRLLTRTMLALRADHARARDAVFADVSGGVLEQLGLFSVQSRCPDKNTFITRPDLGRLLSDEAEKTLREKCLMAPDVQIYAADGLSSTAIEVNLPKILPVLQDSLEAKHIRTGTPFFLKYGRVASEDHVSEILGCKTVCVLIGERPGLQTAESMSAYIAYNASRGMPEARRTVVSNIHKNGTAAVEAGAYIADVIGMILEQQASGIDLVK